MPSLFRTDRYNKSSFEPETVEVKAVLRRVIEQDWNSEASPNNIGDKSTTKLIQLERRRCPKIFITEAYKEFIARESCSCTVTTLSSVYQDGGAPMVAVLHEKRTSDHPEATTMDVRNMQEMFKRMAVKHILEKNKPILEIRVLGGNGDIKTLLDGF